MNRKRTALQLTVAYTCFQCIISSVLHTWSVLSSWVVMRCTTVPFAPLRTRWMDAHAHPGFALVHRHVALQRSQKQLAILDQSPRPSSWHSICSSCLSPFMRHLTEIWNLHIPIWTDSFLTFSRAPSLMCLSANSRRRMTSAISNLIIAHAAAWDHFDYAVVFHCVCFAAFTLSLFKLFSLGLGGSWIALIYTDSPLRGNGPWDQRSIVVKTSGISVFVWTLQLKQLDIIWYNDIYIYTHTFHDNTMIYIYTYIDTASSMMIYSKYNLHIHIQSCSSDIINASLLHHEGTLCVHSLDS